MTGLPRLPAGRVWGALWLCTDTLCEALVAVSTLQADIASIDTIRVFPTVHVRTGTLLMFPAWLQHSVPTEANHAAPALASTPCFPRMRKMSATLWGNE